MSVVLDLLPSAPYELPSSDVQATTAPSYTYLFLDSETNNAYRTKDGLDEFNVDADDEDDDDDDSVTVIWFTPRPKPRVLSLEEPDDGFELDAPASSPDPDSDSDSSGSGSSSSSGDEFWGDEESSSSSASSIMSMDRPPAERELTEEDLNREEDESWLDEDDCSSDDSGISDDEEGECLLDALVKHEEQLGGEFAYFEEARDFNNFETNQSLKDIIRGVRKTSDTYVAAMRIFLKVIDTDESGSIEDLKAISIEIQNLAWNAALEWLEEDPEESRALGRARFALIGQLTRIKLFPVTVVSTLIEELDHELHLEDRMNALQALVRYAGPRVCTEETMRALEKVEEACSERPGDYMMQWMYSKIKKDMLVYVCRNHYVGEYNGRLKREDLIHKVVSQTRKRRGQRARDWESRWENQVQSGFLGIRNF